MPFETLTLNDGNKMPAIAFGTGTAVKRSDNVPQYIRQALDAGFSHIDTAQLYKTEDAVGQAIRDVARSNVYVTSKYSNGEIQESIRASLDRLKLDYLDLYLIHWPSAVQPDIDGGWKQFERIKDDGLAKSIGVSNFTLEQLQSLVKSARILPAANQISFSPYNYAQHKALLAFSAEHGIVIEAYSALAPMTKARNGPLDAPLAAIAARLGISPTQVLLLWVRAKGVVVVTTSLNQARLEEYLAVGDLPPLSEADIADIDAAGALGSPAASA